MKIFASRKKIINKLLQGGKETENKDKVLSYFLMWDQTILMSEIDFGAYVSKVN